MAGARQGEAGDHPGSMQQQPGSPRRAGAGRREGGGGSHPIALEGIHGAPMHWHKKGVGRACESLCKRQRRGAQGGGRLRLVLTRYPSREGGCRLVWRSLQPETRSTKLRAAGAAAAAAHGRSTAASRGSAAQGEGKGRGWSEPPHALGTRTGYPESQGTPAPLSVSDPHCGQGQTLRVKAMPGTAGL